MNPKVVFGFLLIILLVIVGSLFASNNLLTGSVFQNQTSNFEQTQKIVNSDEQTPTDYAIQKLTVYEPSEVNNSTISSVPNDDQDINEKGISRGTLSTSISSPISNTYYIRAIIKNLGTSIAALPKTKVELNGVVLSDISGAVEYTKVSRDGMELIIKFNISSPYTKSKGLNNLNLTINEDGQIQESNRNNNSASVVF